jgi:hypothetical protein
VTTRLLMLAALAAAYPSYPAYPTYPSYPICSRCSWHPPAAARTVDVRNVDELERAAATARPGDTLLIADGEYRLRRTISLGVPDVTMRGRSGDATRVVLRGEGMTSDVVGTAVAIAATGVTVADLTIRDVRWHAVQVRGEAGASRFMLHNARLQDAGQQLVKVSVASHPPYADDGTIACSEIGYTDHAPGTYTNGVDVIAGRGWTIRDNRFTRIRGPEADGWRAGPAILAWGAAAGTLVERNLIVDASRGIALGLGAGAFDHPRGGERRLDHAGGIVRQNVIVNRHAWADEGIETSAAAGVRIEHNTVLVEGRNPWSISIRFPVAAATVRNNLTSRPIVERTGGRTVQHGNVSDARPDWFVDPAALDLRLTMRAGAIDAGVTIDGVVLDFDRQPRVSGRAPDAGAYEYRGTARGGTR